MEYVEIHIECVRFHIEIVGLHRNYAELLRECIVLHREAPAPSVPGDSSSCCTHFGVKWIPRGYYNSGDIPSYTVEI